MTHRIVAAENPEEVQALRPLLDAYFRVIEDILATFGEHVDFAPMMSDLMTNAGKVLPPHGRTYYAVSGGGVVGMGFLKPLGSDFELKRLYVSPSAQGSGLGRQLLKHAMADARGLGAAAIYLDSLRALTAAVQLYEAEGFGHIPAYPTSEIAGHASVLPHAVFMRCAL